MIWLAILITVVSSTSCSVGKALQKEATRHLPRFSASDRKILAQYLHSRVWLTGLAADVGGAVLQIAAFALAPVSIVQPVSGVGLVGLAVYSHLFLKEKMHALEWGAVALAFVGTIGLGATGSDGDAAGSGGAADAAAAAAGADGAGGTAAAAAVKAAGAARQVVQPGAFRMLGVVLLLSAGVLLVSLLRQRHHHRQRRPGDRTTAATYGLQAGACFGLSAASCRIGFLLAQRLSKLWVAVGLGGSVTLSSSGFVLQTLIVCTLAAVSSMVTGVLVGVLGLAEALPQTAGAVVTRVLSWACVLLGVTVLANGAGGARELAAVVLSKLPDFVWKVLPVSLAVKMKSWATHRVELPELAAPELRQAGSGAHTKRLRVVRDWREQTGPTSFVGCGGSFPPQAGVGVRVRDHTLVSVHSFKGDQAHLLDKLIAASQRKEVPTEALKERTLVPFFDSSDASATSFQSLQAGRRPAATKPLTVPKQPQAALQHGLKRHAHERSSAHLASSPPKKEAEVVQAKHQRGKPAASAASSGGKGAAAGSSSDTEASSARKPRPASGKKHQREVAARAAAPSGGSQRASPPRKRPEHAATHARAPAAASALRTPAKGTKAAPAAPSSKFAGPAFTNSPTPDSLPIPTSSLLLQEAADGLRSRLTL
ncbi:hypothetical protein CHLNCDRAFT_136216 [Chlorella variabilis]|uniref:Probable magnesium transporter n=1 Tax=Chlorella variabilis TaxID=554065 RepID=E1ZJ86_CHLVA|nr:hypothetical protein CHLNCDRAFT_136216 [Chlorella variabilis]EFN54092.1 hypothetical protein CHLNCDRAFT_136216 [Chlorella variabilis]|eukprot:XP_005846194.1 hypothetical protein CHLNCDRAFT_136216 [Chlorella variabilis]